MGCTTKNYALHVPMLINRKNGLELINIMDGPMIRCLYGNYFNVGGEEHTDVKIDSITKEYKDTEYLSTNDKSFGGVVGQQIKDRFKNKCKYED